MILYIPTVYSDLYTFSSVHRDLLCVSIVQLKNTANKCRTVPKLNDGGIKYRGFPRSTRASRAVPIYIHLHYT